MHNLVSTVEVDSVLPANPATPSGASIPLYPLRGPQTPRRG